MVSAVCPNCRILLVEADTNSFANIGLSVNEAAALGAVAISNSYGAYEGNAPSSVYADYNHPGIAVVASSGDSGYYYGLDVNFPASSQYVTAVGGTTLMRSSGSRGWSETAWSGAGSGCSSVCPKPAWQVDKGCSKRMVADVAAVANPATGVSVYDSEPIPGYNFSGWLVFGGTSVSSPIVASIYALAGNTRSLAYGSDPYSHTISLFDVTQGTNDGTCVSPWVTKSQVYFCSAQPGYDGPTGLGTPNGMGAF